MNFIVTNSYVIVPSYLSDYPDNNIFKGKEQEVTKVLKKVYPDKEILWEQATISHLVA